MPTTLLDWTTNPLIALFFAAERASSGRQGVVLRFAKERFQVLKTADRVKPFLENRSKPALADTSAMNVRTLAQDSVMSIHCDGCHQMEIKDENQIFQVPETDKWLVRAALKQFGLTAERLYSDINVAAREFAAELELDGILS